MTVNFYVEFVKNSAYLPDKRKYYTGHLGNDKLLRFNNVNSDEIKQHLVLLNQNPFVLGDKDIKKSDIKINFVYPQTDKQKEALRRGQQLRWLMGCKHVFERNICEYTDTEKIIRKVISNSIQNLIDYYPNNTKKILEKWK